MTDTSIMARWFQAARTNGRVALGLHALLAVLSFLLVMLGLAEWARVDSVSPPLYPAAGLMLAMTLVLGIRAVPAMAAGALCAQWLSASHSMLIAVLLTLSGAIPYLFGALVLRRRRMDPTLMQLWDLLALLLVAAACSMVSGLLGATSLMLANHQTPWTQNWLAWAAGDLVGVMAVCPLLLSWSSPTPVPLDAAWRRGLAICLVVTVLVALLPFSELGSSRLLPMMVLPCSLWAAVRCGVRGATLTLVPVIVIAVWGTANEHGLFASAAQHAMVVSARYVMLQQFLLLTIIATLLVAVLSDQRRETRQLHQSEQRFRLAAEAVRGIIYECDLVTGVVQRTSGLREVLGYEPDEVPPTVDWWEKQVDPDDVRRCRESFADLIRSPARYIQLRYRILHRDGHWVDVEDRALIVRDAAGVAVRLVGCTVDISERTRAEVEVQSHNQQLATIAAASRELIMGSQPDTETLNRAFAQLCHTLGFELFFSYLLHPTLPNTLLLAAHFGLNEEELKRFRVVKFGELLCGNVASRRQRIIIEDALHSSMPEASNACAVGITCYTGFPLMAHDRLLGTVAFASRLQTKLRPGDIETIQSICDQVASTLERQRLFAELAQSEARFRAVQETSPNGFMVFESIRGADGRIEDFRWVYANESSARMIGRPRESFIGKQLLVDMPGNRETGLFDAYVQVVESGHPHRRELHYARDGVNSYLSITVAKVGDGFAVSFEDFTDRRKAELAVLESEARFRRMANSLPQLAWMARPDGYLFWYNDRWYEYTGMPRESQEGWGWASVHDPAELPRVVDRWRQTLRAGEPWEDTFPLRRHDGVFRWFLSRAQPVRDDNGQVILWIGTNTDIEDERHALAEAERIGRMKDEFLATLSHELRTPLNAMLGWVQLLRRTQGIEHPDLVEGLTVMERSARAQAQLINDLLDMNRITSGKVRLEMQRVDLGEVVMASIDVIRPTAAAKNVIVLPSVERNQCWIHGDANRLQQVIWNLLNNAVKFTPADGVVWVEMHPIEGRVVLAVRDTGHGISPDFLPYVFDRFRQADGSASRRHGGLGLGLAIVKSLVELHGGQVSAESDGEGLGARFKVTLPLTSAHVPKGQQKPAGEQTHDLPVTATAGVSLGISGLRILVVDDDNDGRQIACRILRECGAIVSGCSSAEEALAVVQSNSPDLLISDIGMPEVDGYELMRRIRALPAVAGGNIPAVAVTAFARNDDRNRALAVGYQAHIAKPFTFGSISAIAEAWKSSRMASADLDDHTVSTRS